MSADLLSVVANVSSPLGLAGLTLVVLALAIRSILRLPIFPRLQRSHTFDLLKRVVDKAFLLALIAIALAFAGFVFTQFIASKSLENRTAATTIQKLRLPLLDTRNIRYVSPAESRSFVFADRFHDRSAIFIGSTGNSIVAVAPGVVRSAGYKLGHGNSITIEHGNDLKSSYSHLQSIAVVEGSLVQARQQIGKMGMTGWATGPQLRFTLQIKEEQVDALATLLANLSEQLNSN